MRVLIAPDKFKGTLTATQVVQSLETALTARGLRCLGLPLADGGDGSVDAAIHGGYRSVAISVHGPTGRMRVAVIAFDGHTCVVEVANTCGLSGLREGKREPLLSSSRGLGEAIREALELAPKRLVVAVGGSASTDGGAGMLSALGMQFFAADGARIDPTGGSLGSVARIDGSGLVDVAGIEVLVASDVQNPLLGSEGAASTYGPQKGATKADIMLLESGLATFVDHLEAAGHRNARNLARQPGAGSAGGIGFAGLLLGASVVSGADFFLDVVGFDAALADCDVVITGEGCLDLQTLNGKLAAVVARRSRSVPVVAVVGRNRLTAVQSHAAGFSAVFSLADVVGAGAATDPSLSVQGLHDLGMRMPFDELVAQHKDQ